MPRVNADELIRQLGLLPHPEGGHYVESYRASSPVRSDALPAERSASTAIYFLLRSGEFSALHRVRSDEVWHHYLGDAVEIHCLAQSHSEFVLGRDFPSGERPQYVVPANVWQAARARPGAFGFALCGCTVAPGFDFADFELPTRDALLAQLPQHESWIRALTRA